MNWPTAFTLVGISISVSIPFANYLTLLAEKKFIRSQIREMINEELKKLNPPELRGEQC